VIHHKSVTKEKHLIKPPKMWDWSNNCEICWYTK